ncbi:hypothetical protein BKA62DRAFT_758524 [Auriculariales sp. MPI-PUGE-AT-0066]|nr:hypothetical protein BKA62DRAFT_758524 [Auriculariales sp. MPI-PUGE-AT-0066]
MVRSLASLVGVERPFDRQSRLVTSPFLSPIALACLRLLMGLSLFVALLASLIQRGVHDHQAGRFFSYFTFLTGIGLTAYLFQAGWLGVAFVLRLRKGLPGSHPLQNWPIVLQALHLILLASVRTLPIIVSIVFWTFLAKGGSLKSALGRYLNISVHALNSVFALFEVFATHTPRSAWFNTIIMVVILGLYVCVAYITHAAQGFYTYSFLDPANGAGKLAMYLVLIPVAEAIIFAIINGLVWLRMRFVPEPRIFVLQEPTDPPSPEKDDEESLGKPQATESRLHL